MHFHLSLTFEHFIANDASVGSNVGVPDHVPLEDVESPASIVAELASVSAPAKRRRVLIRI